MSEYNTFESVPTDALIVSRRLMRESKATLKNIVKDIADELEDLPATANEANHYGLVQLDKEEYARKKLTNPRLALCSIANLADKLTGVLHQQAPDLAEYARGVGIEDAQYEEIDAGQFVIGLKLDEASEDQFAEERTTIIDVMLDELGFSPTDEFRQWRNEESSGFWLPIMQVASTDPEAEKVAEHYAERASTMTAGMTIDFYDTLVKIALVDVLLKDIPQD